ncbi:hypothetical protein [Dyadobacter arcticus]|uniref:Uncharacterized protein n=1 Tax=Dyadobacter arcticus TaxID=1078754 RepID=A0ABX0UGQ9_9BACT|nr:hypothetical protein [Dyadobacter arcticus]NIJ52187.1 hypothetical protein [Dyadobacter arcticus]
MMELNSREIASLILIGLAFIFCVQYAGSSLFEVLKRLTAKPIIVVLLLSTLWTAGIVTLLEKVGIWNPSLLKATVIWFITTALVTPFKAVINEYSVFDRRVISTTLLDSIKLTELIILAISAYTLNVFYEVILGAALTLTVLLSETAKLQGNKSVTTFFSVIQIILGSILVINSVFGLINNFDGFWNTTTLYEFAIPIVLTFLYLPFIYSVIAYVTLEFILIRVPNHIPREILRYSKFKAIMAFGFDKTQYKRWIHNLIVNPVSTKQDVNKSIADLLKYKLEERNPTHIDARFGWSPFVAKKFMEEVHLGTGDYLNNYQDVYGATSNPMQVTNTVQSKIHYYIEGTSEVVQMIQLTLNCNYVKDKSQSLQTFADYSKRLVINSLNIGLDENIEQAIYKMRKHSISHEGKSITLTVTRYDPGKQNEIFDMRITIKTLSVNN